MTRTVIRGALVADGTGAEAVGADLACVGTKITEVGDVAGRPGDVTIDGRGLVAMPGLIDAHSHAAPALRPSAVSTHRALLAQGVTTVLLGQDGMGWAPTSARAAVWADAYFRGIDGPLPAELRAGQSVGGLLDHWDRAAPVNVAYLVPGALIRYAALESSGRPAGRSDIARMTALIDAALDDGAVGLSTGLEYIPGVFTDVAELAQVCRPVAAAGAVHVSHMRGYGPRAPAAISELAAVSARSAVATHISHLRGRAADITPELAVWRASGMDVTFDSYPYQRACTLLAMRCLPPELQAGGVAATVRSLADATTFERLRRSWLGETRVQLADYVISYAPAPDFAGYEGRRLGDAARQHGTDLARFVRDLLMDTELATTCVIPARGADADADYTALLADPGRMAGSDGIYVGTRPHPRGWGAFARMLRRDVRERGVLSWGQASWQLAGHAAARFGLTGRGLLRPGYAADIALCDPRAVREHASYTSPAVPASGMTHVFVNGELSYQAGEVVQGARAGRAIRRGETP
jgi:N-acyl-D-amino-acid deacylase